jgi:hypothetical protein
MFNWLVENAIGTVPVWVWPFIAGIGFGVHLLTHILGRLPEIRPYALFIRVISVFAMFFGVFMAGSAGVSQIWQAQVQKAEEKVKIAEEQSKQVDIKIVTKVVKKTQFVEKRQESLQQEVKEEKVVIDKDCRIPKEFVKIVNKAAEPVND